MREKMDKRLEESFKVQSIKEKFNIETIERLEKYFSIVLPSDYKEFLLDFGAVTIEAGLPDSFIVKYLNEKRVEDILNFLSEQEILEAYKTLRTENEYEGEAQIPVHFIPIAHTNESYHWNYILLDKRDNSIWLTMEDESTESDKDSFGFIAHSFTEFLDKIDEYDKLTEVVFPSNKKEETKQDPIPKITLKSKETIPKTGRYQATLPAGHPAESIIKNSGFDTTRKIEGDNIGTFGLSGSDEDDIEWRYVGE